MNASQLKYVKSSDLDSSFCCNNWTDWYAYICNTAHRLMLIVAV